MESTPLPQPSDADVLAWRADFADRFGLHPVSLLVNDELANDFTTVDEFAGAWRRLGFAVRQHVDDGWSDDDEVVRPTDRDGFYAPHPAVPDGFVRVEAYATEDGDCVYFDARPETDWARRAMAALETLGWPEPIAEDRAGVAAA